LNCGGRDANQLAIVLLGSTYRPIGLGAQSTGRASATRPIEVIERGEIDRIWRMIYQPESGVPT
jgi:hypothetical protein